MRDYPDIELKIFHFAGNEISCKHRLTPTCKVVHKILSIKQHASVLVMPQIWMLIINNVECSCF